MSLLALGLNHHTAPLEVREKAVFAPEALAHTLQSLRQHTRVSEAVILSTCNRTEIYCHSREGRQAGVIDWMHHYLHAEQEQFSPFLFQFRNRLAVEHLMRVCSGLDSMALGEPQILGQVKQAYHASLDHGAVGTELGHLFERAFRAAKQVRTDTAIGSGPVSVAYAAAQLSTRVFEQLPQKTALLIGAGETCELVARHLQGLGLNRFIVLNRTASRAEELASRLAGSAATLSELPQYLPQADIVVASTAAPLPILGKGIVESALRQRRHRPMLMLDLAVPRDIEPQVSALDDVFLYSVDDLQEIADEGRHTREQAASDARAIIDLHVDQFLQWQRGADARALRRTLHQGADRIQQQLTEQALQQLARGESAEAVVQRLAHQLRRKLLHAPSQALLQAGESHDTALLAQARRLFDLPQDTP